MKRLRIITAGCLAVIAILVAGNVWYLCSLYNSIKEQTLQTVNDCVRRADILEIISRTNRSSNGEDDSFIQLTLRVQGEKRASGGYDYPNILGNLSQTMSEYFHLVDDLQTNLPERNYSMLTIPHICLHRHRTDKLQPAPDTTLHYSAPSRKGL